MKNDTPFEVLVNDKKVDVLANQANILDIVSNADGTFHILRNQKKYLVEVLSFDKYNKTMQLKINGNIYIVNIQDKYDQLVSKLGLNKTASIKINEIKAQMPGLVLEIDVKEGDTIQKGDKVLILEAMKMENVIKALGEGVVKKIHVKKGQSIEKGQLLIELE
jgi:biotin carboxyl carrier protein